MALEFSLGALGGGFRLRAAGTFWQCGGDNA
jgi:hypothetical protein